jgi:hypothetical protein
MHFKTLRQPHIARSYYLRVAQALWSRTLNIVVVIQSDDAKFPAMRHTPVGAGDIKQ